MQCKWLQCIWKLDIMNGQSVTNNRICGGNVMSQAKIFKLLSEAYGLTWSGGIAVEVIDIERGQVLCSGECLYAGEGI